MFQQKNQWPASCFNSQAKSNQADERVSQKKVVGVIIGGLVKGKAYNWYTVLWRPLSLNPRCLKYRAFRPSIEGIFLKFLSIEDQPTIGWASPSSIEYRVFIFWNNFRGSSIEASARLIAREYQGTLASTNLCSYSPWFSSFRNEGQSLVLTTLPTPTHKKTAYKILSFVSESLRESSLVLIG